MSLKSRTIAVFGGTFDPPHRGHFLLAKKIVEESYADEILFIPALNPPHKPVSPSADFRHRMKMVEIMVGILNEEKGNHFSVSGIEGQREDSPSFTYDTMKELENKYPGKELILLLGEDSLVHLHTWYKSDRIVKNWKILTYPRNCKSLRDNSIMEELKKKWPDNIAYLLFESILPYELCDISSTEIRAKIADRKDISNLIHPEVYQYINQKGLYKRG